MSNPGAAGRVRLPAVAGTFYPAKRAQLRQMVYEFLHAAGVSLERAPKAIIAPHAGYKYSGPIAGSAFACLRQKKEIKRVVLLGPSHHVDFPGLALSEATGFATPLGVVPVDQDAAKSLAALPQVRSFDLPHAEEHCLEVELPFLQQTLGPFKIVPLLTGRATDYEVKQAVEALWNGPETLFVISSDLSHYCDYDVAWKLDRRTAEAIEHLQPEKIGLDQACGRIALRGFLSAAREHKLHSQTLDLRSSGDTAGGREWVVGYGAFAFTEPDAGRPG